jgi:hypothetical protein
MRHARIGIVMLLLGVGCGPTNAGGPTRDGGGGAADAGTSGQHDTGASVDLGPADAPPCESESVAASVVTRPVDIIWAIDNSGSMDAEEARVQNNINAFATTIGLNNIDYHVIMITDASHVVVPAPLGTSPRFLAVNQHVDSHDALELIVQTYPQWQSFLRPDSIKHFVVVSDDNSDWSATQFETALGQLTDPGFPDGFIFHAIVAEAPPWATGTPCLLLSAARGQVYITLQETHGGVFYSLCLTDWTPVFTALSTAVQVGVELPCTYDIPDPPVGQDLSFDHVNFDYTPSGGSLITIPSVGDSASCAGEGGWYYDDVASPTEIIVCPATCAQIEASGGTVDVAFGCQTILE